VHDPILFDLDGTLVDSGPAIVAAVRSAARSVGAPVDEGSDLSFCVGPPLEEVFAHLLGEAPALVPRAIKAYRREYVQAARRSTLPMPGAEAALDRLAEAGSTLAVVTYKPAWIAEVVLRASGLFPRFALVAGRARGRDDLTKADLLQDALARLEPHSAAPLFVGDHDLDEEAARANGVAFARYGPLDWPAIADLAIAPARRTIGRSTS
jgi:phosphoglycolate phosphatase